ncbi:MAG TPA: DUF1552 domain-containing protein [Polyangiaceae bacterium]|jgi:hypothetical protein
MSSLAWSRRSFLRAVGAGAAALPFFKLLEHSAVDVQAGTLPLKFIGLYHPHGSAAELWRPQLNGTDFNITYTSCSLQPFDDAATYGTSFKDKIIVIDGIDHVSGKGGHDSAATIFTGSNLASNSPGNSSIDQFLAIDQGLGASTRLSSISLGVGNNSTDLGWTLSWAKGAPLPKIIDPAETFDKLFGGFATSTDPVAQAAAARKRKIGQSVIDFVRKDVNRLHSRLGPTEQQKLDQHLTSLRELEKQLADVSNTACLVPTKPIATGNTDPSLDFTKTLQYNGGEPYFDRITNLQIDLLAQGMACDITRFATLLMNDLSHTGFPLGLPDDVHGGVAHVYDGSHDSNYGQAYAGNSTTWEPLARMNKYSYGKAARLLQRLRDFGILDTTLVYMSSDMGNPSAHSTNNVPTVLAGGVGGKLAMGRFIQLSQDCPPDRYFCSDDQKTLAPNGRLLVSIANAFGVDIGSYGNQPDPAMAIGALTQLG